jgi:hypothetical protein
MLGKWLLGIAIVMVVGSVLSLQTVYASTPVPSEMCLRTVGNCADYTPSYYQNGLGIGQACTGLIGEDCDDAIPCTQCDNQNHIETRLCWATWSYLGRYVCVGGNTPLPCGTIWTGHCHLETVWEIDHNETVCVCNPTDQTIDECNFYTCDTTVERD